MPIQGFPGWDTVEGFNKVANYIWNTATLAWQKSTSGSAPGTDVSVTNFPATQPISAASLPLPTGAATAALQLPAGHTVDVTDKPTRDLGKVDIAALDQYTPVTGRLPVDGSGVTQPVSCTFWPATQPVSGTVTANPITAYGKTLTYVPVAQGVAGTTQLASADASNKHKVVGCILTMSLVGTIKFLDSSGDLTGAMDVGTTGGFVLPAGAIPWVETGAINRSISITTTLGAAKGVVILLTEA